MEKNQEIEYEIAVFAGGCFWCTEAIFLALQGVKTVVSGYTGGMTSNPTYAEICNGNTGHAEAIRVVFDSTIITFETLLEVFFATHDPTTLNRQGNDVGTQYRSAIFYENENQKKLSLAYIALLSQQHTFGNPIVTTVVLASVFYPAETEHSNYYNQNKNQSYCSYVITPKMNKLKTNFEDKGLLKK